MASERRQHRQHHRRQHRLQKVRADKARVIGVGEQHKTKFAARAQCQTGAQRHAGRRAEQTRNAEDQESLRHHQRHQDHAYPGILHHDTNVEQHANGDKKQPQQHVAKRLDVFLDLVAIFGL